MKYQPSALQYRIRAYHYTSTDAAVGKKPIFRELSRPYFDGSTRDWQFLMETISRQPPEKSLEQYLDENETHIKETETLDAVHFKFLDPRVVTAMWPVSTQAGIDWQVCQAHKELRENDDLGSVTIWFQTIERNHHG